MGNKKNKNRPQKRKNANRMKELYKFIGKVKKNPTIMDDDIDIEEHDVMDNPRIKSIFPDLSRVKIEIPDEEDIVEEQYNEFLPPMPQDEPQEMLYQYEYSFETTEDNIQDENEEYVEENTYFYNNEIILGSKPPVDLDALYEEALHSYPIVYLENWEERLKSSPCFCSNCAILFPTVNALDAHKMISHSYLVALDTPHRNTARKSTVTSKYCNHCSKTFPDDTSLIKHLYELLPLNNFSQEPQDVQESIQKRKKFTSNCIVLPKKIKSTSHMITKIHPKKKFDGNFKFEVKDKSKLRDRIQKDGKFFATSSLVPKSTLFQCNVCQLGFISCFGALQHSKACEKVLPFEKCRVCKRKIRTKDVKIHVLQHNYNDKLKIYTINKSIYERVLCKCPKCSSCFDELGFWAHYQKCKKSEKKSITCHDCDLNIASTRYQSHRLKHSMKKFTKKDFIVIEFHDHNLKKTTDNKLEAIRIQRLKERAKKLRRNKVLNEDKDNNITLYHCQFCGCCQYILNYKGHTDGACNTIPKKYCEKCGLCFTLKSIESHLVLHEKRNFSLKDINIVNLSTGKSIDPPMPDLYTCNKCTKHFLYPKNLRLHNCKTEKCITCKICTKKFNIEAFKIHKLFHSADKLMPELMKKYNSINSVWNIMYMCTSCELVTMTYDSAVTHSQGHLNYIISDLHKLCEICDLRIAEKEYLLHDKLHSNNRSIERDSFKILKYNFEDLFRKEWMSLFKDLPKYHKQQILSKSIYRYTRSVKMQIEISAPTDDTKYFCMTCHSFVEGANIKQHMQTNCIRKHKYVCNICHEIFKSLKQFLTHVGSHENVPKRSTIVTFNNECDREFNTHLSLKESKFKHSKKSKDMPLSKLREILTSGKKSYKIYKCAKCETCVSLKSSVNRHHCVTGAEKKFCTICNQYFSSKKTALHMDAHRKKPSITKDKLIVVYFNELEKKTKMPTKEVVAKIFECECGLHFTSLKTIEKHLETCSPNLAVSKETCSKCKLVFPTEVLVTHLINHHSKETRVVIEKVVKVNLFKCPYCAVLFTNMIYFDYHTENCDSIYGKQCGVCRLTFGKRCFPRHLCSSGNTKYINKITTVKKVLKQATVFKCESCDLNYLRQKTFKYHVVEANHRHKPPLVCQTCGLKFTNCSFQKHIKLHSFKNDDYKIKVINPVSGDYVFLTGNNSDQLNGSTDPKRSSLRKRKLDNPEIKSALAKKAKSLNDSEITPKRKIKTKEIDKPSTSRNSKINIDSANEILVPEISESTDNISHTDIEDTTISPEKNNSTPPDKSLISKKLKSRILVGKYSRNLYKCVYCNQHYMKDASFDYHVKNHRLQEPSENYKCDICNLEFSRYTLPRHKYVHHDKMRLNVEDFVILTESTHSKESEIYQRIAKLKRMKKDSKIEILDSTREINDNINEIANSSVNINDVTPNKVNVSDICDTKKDSTVEILDSTREIHGDTSEIDNSSVHTNNIAASEVNVSDICDTESENMCYYKCSDCNVCFVNQKMCYEHTFEHTILDPKTYIQCKICDFQFLIDFLKEHMNVHHNSDFRIENLTIHEYKALGIGLEPKIEVYQAVDKVQSRLVSTTTDVGVV